MPAAAPELQAKFPDGDQEAIDVIRENFVWRDPNFVIRKKDPKYQPTQREYDAIQYLADEWDWSYDLRPEAKGV